MVTERFYTVQEVFDILATNKVTSNIESVRRWLRQGKLVGIAPKSRKEGWQIPHTELMKFLDQRTPNTTNVVLGEEAIRATMWFEVTRKNIWEGYIPITKSLLKEAALHRQYSTHLREEVWERCVNNSMAYKQPRVNYLLDAFSFEGQRLKFDLSFASKEEQAIYVIFEYVKKN